ncbi:MAG: Uma2 family endonuclease [Isosphaeraceae bacterium]
MSIAAPLTAPATRAGDQRVVLPGVGWEGYETILKLKGDRRYPKMVYLDGSVSFVSPSYSHELIKERLASFLSEVLIGLGVRHLPAGSTTFRKEAKRGGVEGDLTYYLSHWERIRGKTEIDLRVDPPPDLAIDVVVSPSTDDAIEAWRRLGVPEVWVCDESQVVILQLDADGRYARVGQSLGVPALAAAEIHAWARRDLDDALAYVVDLRRWVAEVLVPRHRELAAKLPTPDREPGNPET